jgi:hypothetical protein
MPIATGDSRGGTDSSGVQTAPVPLAVNTSQHAPDPNANQIILGVDEESQVMYVGDIPGSDKEFVITEGDGEPLLAYAKLVSGNPNDNGTWSTADNQDNSMVYEPGDTDQKGKKAHTGDDCDCDVVCGSG